MPRVNRDLQRRLAARRERSRRPTERRYNFTTAEPAEVVDDNGTGTEALDTAAVGDQATPSAPAQRSAPGAARGAQATSPASTRGGARATPRPFSDYKEDYAYVYADLRRVALVVGGLLVALIVLYFVLPLLVH